jgi:predicted RNase H-like nuclease
MTVILGIDCATQPRKTGLALAELREGSVRIARCRVGSKSEPPAVIASQWLQGHDEVLIALDAPLGWPRALGRELATHRAGAPLESGSNELFSRDTDRAIWQRLGKQPLEVGANLIARTAEATLAMLGQLRQSTGRAIPLAWSPQEEEPWRAIEVYPAATRIAHGTLDRGGCLDDMGALIDSSVVSPEVLACADAADACVCALAGADFLLGRAIAPSDRETALTEGWIWAPGPMQECS